MSLQIQLEAVSKEFGDVVALKNVSATIQTGDRICVLGHNGAGKSTLLNLVGTLTKPSSGTIAFNENEKPLQEKIAIRSRIALLSHQAMLYPDLTALENLRFVARMTGKPATDAHLMPFLQEVDMTHAAHRLFRTFSRGMQQRVSLARALLASPSILLLDEPFSGLDHKGVTHLKSLFSSQEKSWVMVTHHFDLGYELANRFWILRRGKLCHDCPKGDLSFKAFLDLCRQAGDSP